MASPPDTRMVVVTPGASGQKRGRAATESPSELALAELDAAISREPEQKLQALHTVLELVDELDESYTSQKLLTQGGVLQLLHDVLGGSYDSEAVIVKACTVLTALAREADTVELRIKHGKESCLGGERVEQLAHNPVPEALLNVDGLLQRLVEVSFIQVPSVADAAEAALHVLTAHTRQNKVEYLREVVNYTLQGEPQALPRLDLLIGTMDVLRDDVAVLLDQAIRPILKVVKGGALALRIQAALLLSTIAEKRPGAAEFLVAEGALPIVVDLLVRGGTIAAKDAAAHLAWLLVKDRPALLAPERGALGAEGVQLVEPLKAVVDGDTTASGLDEGDVGPAGSVAAFTNGVDRTDFGEDAAALLAALAKKDSAVNSKIGGNSHGRGCVVM